MKQIKIKYLIVAMFASMLPGSIMAQEVYTLDEESSKLSVTGTSSLHDWEMEATDFHAETRLKWTNDSISEIEYIQFTAPVTELESGNNTMNDKTYDALKANKYPRISFTLNDYRKLVLSGDNTRINGQLTVAGKTRQVEVPVRINMLSDRSFIASGYVDLKMSDFGIKPPTVFFGTLKTGNEVKVAFDLEFTRSI